MVTVFAHDNGVRIERDSTRRLPLRPGLPTGSRLTFIYVFYRFGTWTNRTSTSQISRGSRGASSWAAWPASARRRGWPGRARACCGRRRPARPPPPAKPRRALRRRHRPSGPPTTTLPLPTTTEPEQLLLTWGADPATSVTVSWSAPGTVAQPAPMLPYSTPPITAANPGTGQAAGPEAARRDRALRRGRLGQLHRRAERPDHLLLPRRSSPSLGPAPGTTTRSATGRARPPRLAPRSRPRPRAGPGTGSPATATCPPRPGTRTPRATSGTSPATTPTTR